MGVVCGFEIGLPFRDRSSEVEVTESLAGLPDNKDLLRRFKNGFRARVVVRLKRSEFTKVGRCNVFVCVATERTE